MADISKIKTPDGNTYLLKDLYARQQLAALTANIMRFIGFTTTTLTDGCTTNPIVVSGKSHTAASGDVVIYDPNGATALNEQEFIWDGSAWREFGSKAALGALAFKSLAEGELTISEPTGATTNTLKYQKVTGVNVSGVPTEITIDTTGNTQRFDVEGSSTGFTYNKPVKAADTTTIIKATASGATVTPTSPVTVAQSVKAITNGKAIKNIGTTAKYLRPTNIYGVSGSNTASKLKSAGAVTQGTDTTFTQGTLPTFSAALDSTDSECLVFSFKQGTKSVVDPGTATRVTLPTFEDVAVPKAATSPTAVFEGQLYDTTSTGAAKVLIDVAATDYVDCITSVGIDQSTTAYTAFTVKNPTITLSKSTSTTPGTGEVGITQEHWTVNTPEQATISFTGVVDIPYELEVATGDFDANIEYEDASVAGTATVTTTSKTYDITVS